MKGILFKYLAKYTSFSEEEQRMIASEIRVDEYKKGTIPLWQGDVPTKCYFVLKGCIRQYAVDALGREVTSNFYAEEQAVVIYNEHSENKTSKYTLTCLEDCVLVVGDLATINDTYNKYPQLESMTNQNDCGDLRECTRGLRQFHRFFARRTIQIYAAQKTWPYRPCSPTSVGKLSRGYAGVP